MIGTLRRFLGTILYVLGKSLYVFGRGIAAPMHSGLSEKDQTVEIADKLDDQRKSEMLKEYSALRDEILKREDMRQHMLTFAVLSAGTVMTLSMQKDFGTVWPLLVYPILATLLALGWMQSDLRIGEIGEYVQTHIESKLEGLYWETYLSIEKKNTRFRSVEATAIGVFLVLQVLAIILALVVFHQGTNEQQSVSPTLLLISVLVDGFAMILTIVFLRCRTIKLYKPMGRRVTGIAILLVVGVITLVLSLGDPISIGQPGFDRQPLEIVGAVVGGIATVVGVVLLALSPTSSDSSSYFTKNGD